MKAPAFWWRPERGLLAHLLAPAGWLYGSLTAARMKRPGARAETRVICVGNFTVGGAGKTPVAIAIASLFTARSQTVFFLSRGYGGSQKGPLLVDPARHDAADVGDEPLLLARHGAVVVGGDRVAAAALCTRLGAEIIIMDDGLQNPSLVKDVTVAVVDATVGAGNGACFPAGPLRAPLAAQWPFVDALIMLGPAGPGAEGIMDEAKRRSIPVFKATLDAPSQPFWISRPLLAFAGIGRPKKFFDHLVRLGATVVQAISFGDHHVLNDGEAARLLTDATRNNAQLVTTEKDFVRMESLRRKAPVIETLLASTEVLVVRAEIEGGERLRLLLGCPDA